METTDVVIIGAGVHGASAAYHFAQRGVRPVVFERGSAAGGPTGYSSAICRAYYTNEFLARVARESLDMFAGFAELTGGRDAGFRKTGALFLHREEDGPQLKGIADFLNSIGTTTELLTRAEVGQRFPRFDLTDIGYGCWEVDAGYADPVGTTTGLLGRAGETGADVRTHTTVAALSRNSNGIVVRTEKGDEVTTRRLLIAAGPWTRNLALQLGVELPLTVERHFVATFQWADAEPVPFAFADIPADYYFKPEGHNQYLVGPLVEEPQADPDDFAREVAPEEQSRLAEAVVRRVPSLEDSVPVGGWASLYDVSPDWQPVIGEIDEGVFVDAGTSGHGFKLAPALGKHVAALVLGDEVPGIGQFHPRRFSEGVDLAGGFERAKILG